MQVTKIAVRYSTLSLAVMLTAGIQNLYAQGTAFTYQGKLNNNSVAANGNYDLVFTLYSASTSGSVIAGPLTNSAMAVSNGLFTTTIDFGANVFNGQTLWLDVAVSPASSNTFTALSPRQPLTSTPYAVQSLNAGTAGTVTGPITLAQLPGAVLTNGATNVSIVGTFSGNGGGLTNLNVAQLNVTGNNLGNQNFFVGPAGNTSTSGFNNTALGVHSLVNNTTGNYNTASGTYALLNNSTGAANTAFGYVAAASDTTGTENTGVGAGALYSNSTGSGNTAIGYGAMNNLINGSSNIVIGFDAGTSFSSYESNNIDIGNQGVAGDNNIIRIGTPGTQTNTYIAGVINGNGAGLSNLNAAQLASVGNTFGSQNFFAGTAGNATTTGSDNTAVGAAALHVNTTGAENTAIGQNALNINTIGGFNTVLGSQALQNNRNGYYNTAIGSGALKDMGYFASGTGGSNNIALGFNAGQNLSTTESGNIIIGSDGLNGDNNTIRIGSQGTQTNTFIAGIYNTTSASGTEVFINSSGKLGTLTSSGRFKTNIQSMADASEGLFSLRPVTFQYKSELDPQGNPQFGLIAEEVEKVNPKLVVYDGQGRIYSVRYQAVNAMLLNEFLKEHKKVQNQESRLQTQESHIQNQQTEIQKLTETNEAMEKRLADLEKTVEQLTGKQALAQR